MSFFAGLLAGINIGRKRFGGSPTPPLSDMGTLKAIVDDGASTLSIILTDNGNNDTNVPILTEYSYTYELLQISDTIITQSTTGETTVTSTQSFSKSVIKKVFNAKGKVIMTAHFIDEEKGEIDYYLDEDGNKIYFGEGYLSE